MREAADNGGAMPGEGGLPGLHDCTPEKRGAGGKESQEAGHPAPPSPDLTGAIWAGDSLVDELLRERRAEAERENRE